MDGKGNKKKGRGKKGGRGNCKNYLIPHNVFEKVYYLYELQA